LQVAKDHPVLGKVLKNEQNWRIADVVVEVAKQIGKTAAQEALNLVATQPGITSTIIGATKIAQLNDNLTAIEFTIPAELRRRLDEVSALPSAHPYFFFGDVMQAMISGNTSTKAWKQAHATGADAPEAPTAKK